MPRAYALLLSALLLPALAACEADIEKEAVALLAPAELPAREARRCPHCGWIESKREIPPALAGPRLARVYEYTLRRADGSSSVFQETLPATWRVGERVVLIESAAQEN
ncbi:MAG: hypothetical protein QOD26_4208 [Betaproteobacteria bacterium]|jgi:hypothetical protein|nr:hypothetical protein [Betaproteobacteria bacterium]